VNKIIVITGASSGFGRLTANALARAGHTVYASMREITGRNAASVADVRKFAEENRVDLRPIELDVLSQESVDRAVAKIIATHGTIDVVVHNAGHMGVHIDPTQDGAEVAFTVIDRMRTDMLHRVGLDELLIPVKVN
jgi:NAD(P)-dependent dehydrogenase (short-subunit alcohol dehydrogenase family)